MSWKPKEFAQCLPCVVAKNCKESIEFYTTAFGFTEHLWMKTAMFSMQCCNWVK